MADQITGFVCYSHVDERLYKELLKHLKTLEGMASFQSDQKILLKLKKIRKFTHKDIEDWIESEVNRLPSTLTTREILAKSDIPEQVLERICTLCGYDWLSQKGAWL